jgi:hypothetical protein
MGRGRSLFSTREKQRQYQMVRFDRLPKAIRDKVNYADKQYYITADGTLTHRDAREAPHWGARVECNRR